MKDDPKKPWKAVFGALGAGLTAAGTAAADGNISLAESIGILSALVVTFAGVYFASNPQVPE